MLGLPPWLWILLGVIAVVFAAGRSFYGRFRGMCKGVRSDLTELARERYSEVTGVHEELGNLIVTTRDGERRVWEMAEVYSAVAQLPGMGTDPTARQPIYETALQRLFPAPNPAAERLADPSRVWPQLLRDEAAAKLGSNVVRMPLGSLGLTVVYLRGPLSAGCYVTEADMARDGLDAATLHQRALDSLRIDFPRDLVETPQGNSGSAIQLGDSLNAARLLLVPEHLKPGGEVVALLPHRDLLVLLPASVSQEPEKIGESLQLLRCDGHPPLLTRAVRITSEGFALV